MTTFEEAIAELQKHDPLKAGELKAKQLSEIAREEQAKRQAAEKAAEERMDKAVEAYLNPQNAIGGKSI